MNLIIREQATGFHYAGPNHWTTNLSQAFVFQDLETALRSSRKLRGTNLEVVLGNVPSQSGTAQPAGPTKEAS